MKSYKVNLDALIVIVILFVCSIEANIYLVKQFNDVSDENVRQKLSLMLSEMNLNSQQVYIKKINEECGINTEKSKEVRLNQVEKE